MKTKPKSGSIAQKAEGFLASNDYLARSESYRRTVRRHAEAIVEQAGDALAAHLSTEDITDDLELLAPNSAAAENMASDLRLWQAQAFQHDQSVTGRAPQANSKGHRA